MALVLNGIDDEFRSYSTREKNDIPTVGFLFHNAELKDFATTRATVIRLQKNRPDVRFLSFGSVMPLDGELPVDTEFHHLPTQELIKDIYRRCDVWLSTSRTEGFNLPPLEAMAGGCPAVCSKTGRPLEIIEDGMNGCLVEIGDVDGFATAIENVLNQSEQSWAEMSKAARRAVAHPTWAESSALFAEALKRATQLSVSERN